MRSFSVKYDIHTNTWSLLFINSLTAFTSPTTTVLTSSSLTTPTSEGLSGTTAMT